MEDSLNVPRYCLKYGLVVLALFGLMQVWQAGGDGPISAFRTLPARADLDPLHVSAPGCMLARTEAGPRRAALAGALTLLDEVHPDVAGWLRDTDRQGKLRFADSWKMSQDGASCLAKYDAYRGFLTINAGIFSENDGVIATILCHEYRHARQRLPKTIIYALSFVWTRGGDPAIVENDALLFEKEAQLAMFGKCLEP